MASGGGRRRKPGRGSRAKPKKTKYLSLSRHLSKAEVETPPLSPEDGPVLPPWQEAEVKREDGGDGGGQQQLEPFALHHEASTLFAASMAPSLTDILGASTGGDESPSPSASPDDVSGGTGFPGAEEEDLARRALRGRERWVYCSSSSSPPPTTTTTASSSPCSSAASTGASARLLLLKLDYEEILAAWAERGSLYIGGGGDGHATPEPELDNVSPLLAKEQPFGVPGLARTVLAFLPLGDTAVTTVAPFVEVEPSQHAAASAAAACAWSAPETAVPGRAERVRRFKEKRRSRLFAKRIRYEVRRVNAVKRPRFKGRFIKENGESELQPA